QFDQLVIDDLDDLLARIDPAYDFLADCLLGDTLDEGIGNIEVDVAIEQRGADLGQALADVGFGKPAATAQLLESVAQTALIAFEHGANRNSVRVSAFSARKGLFGLSDGEPLIIGRIGTGCNRTE